MTAVNGTTWRITAARAALAVGLVLGILPSNPPTSAHAAPIDKSSLSALGQSIAGEQGEVKTVQAAGERLVFVFEERHDVPAVHVEIARMFVKLYSQKGVRDLALEGVVKGADLKARWDDRLGFDALDRRRAATALLGEGEIDAGEYLALVLPDLKAHATENAAEYALKSPEGGYKAIVDSLLRIAAKSDNPTAAEAAREALAHNSQASRRRWP